MEIKKVMYYNTVPQLRKQYLFLYSQDLSNCTTAIQFIDLLSLWYIHTKTAQLSGFRLFSFYNTHVRIA